jgi:CysZ protein
MLNDLTRAISQICDRRVLRPLVLSIVAATVMLGSLIYFGFCLVDSLGLNNWNFSSSYLKFLNGALGFLIDSFTVLIGISLFPAVAVCLQAFFLDDVVDAVETKHYSYLQPCRPQRLKEIITASFRFATIALALNLMLLGVWLLFLLIAPVLAPIPFFLVNGYLLGREYFELIASRRVLPSEVKAIRKHHSSQNLKDGILLTFLFSVPLVNLVAPILATSYMTHRFHRIWKTDLTPNQTKF